MGRKPVERPSNPVDDGPMLKMKELVEATGISKATILYYVSEKLLPRPVKTSPNVAYYPASTIERISLIRELQSRHRFSLSQIRAILKGQEKGRDLETLIEFNREVFNRDDGKRFKRAEFRKSCGLTEKDLKAAIELGLIFPDEDGYFDNTDLSAGKLLKQNLELGLSLADFSYYARAAEEIVSHEMALRRKVIQGMSADEDLTATLRLTRSARFFRHYIIERTFKRHAMQHLVQKDRAKPS